MQVNRNECTRYCICVLTLLYMAQHAQLFRAVHARFWMQPNTLLAVFLGAGLLPLLRAAGPQFTCFTDTKVQILTLTAPAIAAAAARVAGGLFFFDAKISLPRPPAALARLHDYYIGACWVCAALLVGLQVLSLLA